MIKFDRKKKAKTVGLNIDVKAPVLDGIEASKLGKKLSTDLKDGRDIVAIGDTLYTTESTAYKFRNYSAKPGETLLKHLKGGTAISITEAGDVYTLDVSDDIKNLSNSALWEVRDGTYSPKTVNANLSVTGNTTITGNTTANGNTFINGNLIINGSPAEFSGDIPAGSFNFSSAIKDAEITYNATTQKLELDCKKTISHFTSSDDSIVIAEDMTSGKCKIDLTAKAGAGVTADSVISLIDTTDSKVQFEKQDDKIKVTSNKYFENDDITVTGWLTKTHDDGNNSLTLDVDPYYDELKDKLEAGTGITIEEGSESSPDSGKKKLKISSTGGSGSIKAQILEGTKSSINLIKSLNSKVKINGTTLVLPKNNARDSSGAAVKSSYTTLRAGDNITFERYAGGELTDEDSLVIKATVAKGDKGDTGPQGPAGPTGATGSTGPQGPAGEQGVAGPKGDDGAQGPAGIQGPSGKDGKDGASVHFKGKVSAKSDLVNQTTAVEGDCYYIDAISGEGAGHLFALGKGSYSDLASWVDLGEVRGVKGDTGPQGPTGAQGEQGIQGPRGEQGVPGKDGPEGPTGPAGVQGEQGIQGPAGPEGPIGPQGKDGASVHFKGKVSSKAELTNQSTAEEGDCYYIDATSGEGAGHLFALGAGSYSDLASWTDLGKVQGAQGPQGPQGDKGDRGEQGIQGEKGDKGDKGDPDPRFDKYYPDLLKGDSSSGYDPNAAEKHTGYTFVHKDSTTHPFGESLKEDCVIHSLVNSGDDSTKKFLQVGYGLDTGKIYTRFRNAASSQTRVSDWDQINGLTGEYYTILTSWTDWTYAQIQSNMKMHTIQDPKCNVLDDGSDSHGVQIQRGGLYDIVFHVCPTNFTPSGSESNLKYKVTVTGDDVSESAEVNAETITILNKKTLKGATITIKNVNIPDGSTLTFKLGITGTGLDTTSLNKARFDPYKNMVILDPSESKTKTGTRIGANLRQLHSGMSHDVGTYVRTQGDSGGTYVRLFGDVYGF